MYMHIHYLKCISIFRIECQKRKIPPTKLNIFAQYIIRVRKNIHLCVAMSPLGEAFRNRYSTVCIYISTCRRSNTSASELKVDRNVCGAFLRCIANSRYCM